MPLTFISLFAGIGGLDLGLERAGLRCVAQVEIDEYACQVLAKHWPNVARYGDIRDCGAHNLPPADCLVGGFPCQDISNAGKRVGIGGERSSLWGEYARLIGELRPRYVLVENVAALLGRGMGVVLGDLVALGYDAEWHCLPAAAVGAPHIRDRVFLLAYAQQCQGGQRCESAMQRRRAQQTEQTRLGSSRAADVADPDITNGETWNADRLGASEPPPSSARHGRAVSMADAHGERRPELYASAFTDRAGLHHWRATTGRAQWAVEPGVGRVVNGVPHRVDRLRGLGNAVVPQVAEYIGRCIVAHAAQEMAA